MFSTSLDLTGFQELEVGAAVVAAGYLLATAGRSRKAAGIGLTAVGLLGLSSVSCSGHAPLQVWGQSAAFAASYGLLVWAILADRPPPADE